MSLLITCYNLKRVLNIIGVDAFRAYCEQRNRSAQLSEKEAILSFFWLKTIISLMIFHLFNTIESFAIKPFVIYGSKA